MEGKIGPPVPSYQALVGPALGAIRSLGGSGNKAEIFDRHVSREDYTPAQLQRLNTKGTEGEIRSRLSWALSDLKNIGALSRTGHTWRMTLWGATVGEAELLAKFKAYRKQRMEGAHRAPAPRQVAPKDVESEPVGDEIWARNVTPEQRRVLQRRREVRESPDVPPVPVVEPVVVPHAPVVPVASTKSEPGMNAQPGEWEEWKAARAADPNPENETNADRQARQREELRGKTV